MEYILFIHDNTVTPTKEEDWEKFFTLARRSGIFQDGSEIGKRILLGSKEVADSTESISANVR